MIKACENFILTERKFYYGHVERVVQSMLGNGRPQDAVHFPCKSQDDLPVTVAQACHLPSRARRPLACLSA